MRHALPLVALCAALFALGACSDDDCTDKDKDGVCAPDDCDDTNPLHHADCGVCSDPDTDGRGVGCDLGPDCSPTNTFHWADCGKCKDTDLDGHGVDCDLGPDCDENDPDQGSDCKACVDADGDGFFIGCDQFVNRPGPDCDDADPNNYFRCGFCADADGDGHFVGCDRYSGSMAGPDCNDGDANNWDKCDLCVDRDGDSYYVGCDKFGGDKLGPDCNDLSSFHHSDCATCTDSDGDGHGTGCDLGADCSDANRDVWTMCGTCADNDLDGYWGGCDSYFQHLGPDCNDANRDTYNTCATCKDGDGDNYWSGCNQYIAHSGPDYCDGNTNAWTSYGCTYCRDNDMDSYYGSCDAYTTVAGPDCSDMNTNAWTSCGTCVDTDGDLYYTGCDRYSSVGGPDCNATDNKHWNDCQTCVDTDGDGRGPGCNLGADCNTTSANHWADCSTCIDIDGDGYGTGTCDIGLSGTDCNDNDGNIHPGAADSTYDGVDQNCDNLDGAPFFTDGFEDAVYTPEWTLASGDTFITTAYHNTGSYCLNVGGGTADVESRVIDTSACSTGLVFRYFVRRGYEAPDPGEDMVVEWWNGSQWTQADLITGNSLEDANFIQHTGYINAPSAQYAGFRLRIRMTGGSGTCCDDYHIDDVALGCGAPDPDGDRVPGAFDCAPNNNQHWSDCGSCTDADGDGYGSGCNLGFDCASGDTNSAQYPGAVDSSADGQDQNCNGTDGPIVYSPTPSVSPFASISDGTTDSTGCGAPGAVMSQITSVMGAGVLTDVDVTLNITHALDSDLDVWLEYRSPSSNPVCVQLTTDNGAAANYTSTVFSDQAASSITAGTAPFTGTFQPESPLSVLNGKAVGGTYILWVTDDTATNTGSLTSWSLGLTYY